MSMNGGISTEGKTSKDHEDHIQLRMDSLIEQKLDEKERFPIETSPWHPYDSKSIILMILDQTPQATEDRLDAMLMTLQAEWCYPINYFYTSENSADDIQRDIAALERLRLIESKEDFYTLTAKGRTMAEMIKREITSNPLEKLPEHATHEVLSSVVTEFSKISENEIKYVKKKNFMKYTEKSGKRYVG